MDDVMGYGPEAYEGVFARHGTDIRPLAGTVNLGHGERLASVLGGIAFVLFGVTRRTWAGRALAVAAGVLLAQRGRTGRSRVYRLLGISSARLTEGAGITLQCSVTVQRPVPDVYSFWRDPANLPRFMSHLDGVIELGPGLVHWDFRGPGDVRLEWDAEVVEDRPGELISWRTLTGSDIEHAGSVHFAEAPGGRGTEVRLRMRYTPAKGAAAFLVAKALGKLNEERVAMELRRFKQLVETGEVATAEGQPAGARGR